MNSPSIDRLIENFEKLPSIGHKTAQRLAFYILEAENSKVQEFLNAIVDAKRKLKRCSKCFNISETDPCPICEDKNRDQSTIFVVEDVKDVLAMERTHEYKGVYHILNGAISPINNVSADDLTIKELVQRVAIGDIKEIIIATNPKVEGETTAMYIVKILKPFDVKLTRIAHGIPVGGDLEYTDEITLTKALKGRTNIE